MLNYSTRMHIEHIQIFVFVKLDTRIEGLDWLTRPCGSLWSNRAIECKAGHYPEVLGSIASAAAECNRERMSVPTLGVTGQFVSVLLINCNMTVTVRTPRGAGRRPRLPLTPA